MQQRRPRRGRASSSLVAGLVALAATVPVSVSGCTAQVGVTSAKAVAAAQLDTSAGGTPVATCSPQDLPTLTAGELTVAVDEVAHAPWVLHDDPATGEGFEAAVAYAVAAQLGYSHDDVRWVRTSFEGALAPGAKGFDVALDQVSITEGRKHDVDFSSPYYDVAQAVVTTTASPAAGLTSLTGLRQLQLGAAEATTGWTALTDVVDPAVPPVALDDVGAAAEALADGSVQAVVVDLPTAFTLAAQVPGGTVLGQLERGGDGGTEGVGMVLEHSSPLTACVSRAVDALRADGTLDRLEQRWLGETAAVPVLR